jgi:hypothetical protein
MQQALRPYVTTGVAIVGASMIAVTPVAAPPIGVQVRPVHLVDAWSDFLAESATNWQNILSGADSTAINQVVGLLTTNPDGVLGALANLTPDVTTNLTSLPGQITVGLPPGLALGIAQLGAWGAGLTALGEVAPTYAANPYEATATILNGFFNGQDNVSLLNGAITIPLWNGLITPLQPVSVDLNLTALINALGLGNAPLSSLDLSSLLSQLGLGNLSLGSLFSDLGLSTKGLGTLLADATNPVTTLNGLLNLLGLNGLGTGDGITLTLTNILSGLGLDTNVNLSTLSLSTVLGAFGLTSNIPLLSDTIGSLLGTTNLDNIVNNIVNSLLGSTLGSLLTPLESTLKTVLDGAIAGDLNITVGQLLGVTGTTPEALLSALGVSIPNGLTIGGILSHLGFSSSTGDLTLGGLLSDLGNPFGALNITDLLNGLNLGTLLGDLGLSNLPVDLTNLGDLSGLTLGGLLGDLGLSDLASVSVAPIGGMFTELVDVVPQQILAALGM